MLEEETPSGLIIFRNSILRVILRIYFCKWLVIYCIWYQLEFMLIWLYQLSLCKIQVFRNGFWSMFTIEFASFNLILYYGTYLYHICFGLWWNFRGNMTVKFAYISKGPWNYLYMTNSFIIIQYPIFWGKCACSESLFWFFHSKRLNSCFNYCRNPFGIVSFMLHNEMHEVKADYRIANLVLSLLDLGHRVLCSGLCFTEAPSSSPLAMPFLLGKESFRIKLFYPYKTSLSTPIL